MNVQTVDEHTMANEDTTSTAVLGKSSRRPSFSGILKPSKSPTATRTALADLDMNMQMNDDTTKRSLRRVSFADIAQVKEFDRYSGMWKSSSSESENSSCISSSIGPENIQGFDSLLNAEICNPVFKPSAGRTHEKKAKPKRKLSDSSYDDEVFGDEPSYPVDGDAVFEIVGNKKEEAKRSRIFNETVFDEVTMDVSVIDSSRCKVRDDPNATNVDDLEMEVTFPYVHERTAYGDDSPEGTVYFESTEADMNFTETCMPEDEESQALKDAAAKITAKDLLKLLNFKAANCSNSKEDSVDDVEGFPGNKENCSEELANAGIATDVVTNEDSTAQASSTSELVGSSASQDKSSLGGGEDTQHPVDVSLTRQAVELQSGLENHSACEPDDNKQPSVSPNGSVNCKGFSANSSVQNESTNILLREANRIVEAFSSARSKSFCSFNDTLKNDLKGKDDLMDVAENDVSNFSSLAEAKKKENLHDTSKSNKLTSSSHLEHSESASKTPAESEYAQPSGDSRNNASLDRSSAQTLGTENHFSLRTGSFIITPVKGKRKLATDKSPCKRPPPVRKSPVKAPQQNTDDASHFVLDKRQFRQNELGQDHGDFLNEDPWGSFTCDSLVSNSLDTLSTDSYVRSQLIVEQKESSAPACEKLVRDAGAGEMPVNVESFERSENAIENKVPSRTPAVTMDKALLPVEGASSCTPLLPRSSIEAEPVKEKMNFVQENKKPETYQTNHEFTRLLCLSRMKKLLHRLKNVNFTLKEKLSTYSSAEEYAVLKQKRKELASKREELEALKKQDAEVKRNLKTAVEKNELEEKELDEISTKINERKTALEEKKKDAIKYREIADEIWSLSEACREECNEAGVSFTFLRNTIRLSFSFGEPAPPRPGSERLESIPYAFLKSVSLGRISEPVDEFVRFAQDFILAGTESVTANDEQHTTLDIAKVLNDVSVAASVARQITEEMEYITFKHKTNIQGMKFTVEFSSVKAHAMFSVSFDVIPASYPKGVKFAFANFIGKFSEEAVFEVMQDVPVRGLYFVNLVCAVDGLLVEAASRKAASSPVEWELSESADLSLTDAE